MWCSCQQRLLFNLETNSGDETVGSPPLGSMESVSDSMLKSALMEQAQMASKTNCETNSSEQIHSCPYCYYTSSSEVRIHMHIASQHSKQAKQQRSNSATPPTAVAGASTSPQQQMLCPLCQAAFKVQTKLEQHLIDVHNVTEEGVQRLMLLVEKIDTTDLLATTKQSQSQASQHSPTWSPNEDSLDSKSEQREMPIMDFDGKSDSGDSSKLCEDDLMEAGGANEALQCPGCAKMFAATAVDELLCHISDHGHLKHDARGNGYQCWKRGCGQLFRSLSATQLHFKEQHAQKMGKISGAAVSDRHVYKYRCSQCSLAFKTIEKLQLHSQYHLIRAATQCVLCGRSFRSVEALQKHVESSHADMSEEELEQYRASLANNPLLFGGRNGGGILDPSTTELLKKESNRFDEMANDDDVVDLAVNHTNALNDELDDEGAGEAEGRESGANGASTHGNSLEDYLNSQAVAEDSYNDPTRKYKCHRCKVAFTRQSYLTSHNKTLLHRKGEKLSYPMEKYLDPNRPYKCDICKESFTQKNILLVHYNSVSHLHKLKQTMKESSAASGATAANAVAACHSPTASTSPPALAAQANVNNNNSNADFDKKPYRCNICKVAYNLGTTLDIHVRSVLHQTRASKLHDLAISGQIDLNVPLIERPDNACDSPAVCSTTAIPGLTTSPKTVDGKASTSPSPTATPKFQEALLQNTELQQAALQQAALNLAMAGGNGQHLMLSGSPFTCQRCGSVFVSQEAQLQHQQICCLFGPPISSASVNAFNKQQSQRPSQSPQPNEQTTLSTASSQPSQLANLRANKFSSYAPVCRSKPPVYKHLLETWGFEIVMQFNECHQRRVRRDQNQVEAKKEGDNASESQVRDNPSQNNGSGDAKEAEQTEGSRVNLPEINRSKCDKCQKEFSSIWVLKAHREEIHRDVVPLDVVEQFADDYRTDYERKCAEEEGGRSPEHAAVEAAQAAGQVQSPPVSMATTAASPVTTQADIAAANQMAAHLQFSQLLMSMGFNMAGMNMGVPMGMNMPFAAAMGLHPPLIPVMMAPQIDPMMAAAFNHPAAAMVNQGAASTPAPASGDAGFLAAQQKLMQQQQQQLAAAQQQKRARTRISDEQLKVLRQYFDINNSPTEEQLVEMSEKSGLPMKVIKHWFRNTLFKERQRNKDSPYNFNNPPSTFLNLEEYEKTGEAKIVPISEIKKESEKEQEANSSTDEKNLAVVAEIKSASSTKDTDYATSDDDYVDLKKREDKRDKFDHNDKHEASAVPSQAHMLPQRDVQRELQQREMREMRDFDLSKALLNTNSPQTSESSLSSQSAVETSQSAASLFASLPAFANALGPSLGAGQLQLALDAHRSQATASANTTPSTSTGSGPSSGKRANRTRFTDYQIKVLQEFFESNAYPKDDDLEYLSKLLNLSPRVIVVWFQNARQKARKVYENQPATPVAEDDGSGRFQRTPGLNYQCKKCMQVFQRYYELIKHQKSACFKDENPLAAQIKAAAESRAQSSSSPGVSREANTTTPTPSDSGRASATPEKAPAAPNGSYRCDKCSLVFSRFELWREHQLVHLMNPNLFPSYPPTSPFGILQYEAQQPSPQSTQSQNAATPVNPALAPQQQPKRKLPEDEDSHDYDSLTGSVGNAGEQPRDKRLRTTILPEQLDYLYQKYQIESNPSRKMLESIAKEVGLKKRVVQVWFQNTRARERKGQFRAHQQVIHKRCPFCRALFKARSALESHLATRHADQYTKGDINIDALPDGDPGELSDTSPAAADDGAKINAANLSAEALQSTMKRYYEDSLKKYLEELNASGKDSSGLSAELSIKMKAALEAGGLAGLGETPLDLSKPMDLSRSLRFSNDEDGFDDSRSEDGADSESSGGLEGDFYDISQDSNPTSPAPGSTTSSTASALRGSGPNTPSGSNKRFRTQMTTVQLKVMKSIFADYKTPSMAECECLGREIGLPKRVVQVWFQNARAKEKKAKIAFAKTFGQDIDQNVKAAEECKICNVKYNLKFSSTSMQDHLFSKKHIENLKLHINNVKKLIEGQDDNSADFPIASGMMPSLASQLVNNAAGAGTPVANNVAAQPDANDSRSKSAANLMQQLQMMGLAGSLPSGLPDIAINGNKSAPEQLTPTTTPKSSPDKPASNVAKDSAGNGSESITGNDNSGLFPYMYPGLQGYYAAAGAAAAFLHPAMYNTATGRNKL